MSRQNSDAREANLLLLSAAALRARDERVRQLKALVAAGVYQPDAGAIARAICRAGQPRTSALRAPARSLDRQVSA